MIEKPDIADEKIISALRQSYSIQAERVEFLPLGWDAASFSYRVIAEEGTYFLKIKRGLPNPAGIFVPRYLREKGFEQVMGALSTGRGEAWAKVDDLYFILYPFIVSRQVWDAGMSDAHWIEFGSVMKRLHTLRLSAEMLGQIRIENFVPPRLEWDKDLHARIKECGYDDPFQQELAEFWLEHYSTISTILQRTEAISGAMHNTDLELVLCHADVHTANLLITEDERLFIVDWDDTLLAPKERDLMFLPGDLGSREQELFFRGYGAPGINALASAYYRYHWCVEDMGGFAEMIFTTDNVGEKTKLDAISWFKRLFGPEGSVETALEMTIEGRQSQ